MADKLTFDGKQTIADQFGHTVATLSSVGHPSLAPARRQVGVDIVARYNAHNVDTNNLILNLAAIIAQVGDGTRTADKFAALDFEDTSDGNVANVQALVAEYFGIPNE